MSKIVLKSLSILLGAFFIFLGALKVTPKISRDLHKDLRTEYAKYAKAFPLARQLDFKVSSKWLRRGVGATEILAGVVLLAVPHRMTKVGRLNSRKSILVGIGWENSFSGVIRIGLPV